MKNPDRAKKILAPFLRPNGEEGPEIPGLCPFHDDNKPSASFNFESGVWCCFAGCGEGKIVNLISRLEDAGDVSSTVDLDAERYKRKGVPPRVSDYTVFNSHLALMANNEKLTWLAENRGLMVETLEEFNIGWDSRRQAFTVPIYDEQGKLVNIRFYRPHDPSRKWRNSQGAGSTRLYPIAQLDAPGDVLICEGEMDCLLAIQLGFNAITNTGGAKRWVREWGPLFAGRKVYICYDCDDAGKQGSHRVASELAQFTPDVYIVNLPYKSTPDKGKDLTDYFVVDGHSKPEFIKLLKDHEKVVKGDLEDTFSPTDLGNAERLIHFHGEDIRYIPLWGRWIIWNGKRWVVDNLGQIERLATKTIRDLEVASQKIINEDRRMALLKHYGKSEASARIDAMIKMARSREGISIAPDSLDRDPWMINFNNGVVNLKTGLLMQHDRSHLITKMVPFDFNPAAKADRWVRFIREVLPAKEDARFIQKAIGYSLTGSVGEHVMFILWGTGSNGKTVFFEVMRNLLADYAQVAPSEMLLARNFSAIPNDVAQLKGARFVTASETDEGRRLAEATTKQLTGGDKIRARLLYQDFFEFHPTHKIWMATNHKPSIRNNDEGMWRRIRLIPFTQTFEKDPTLQPILMDEAEGILAWAVDGCLMWQREGLKESRNVLKATQQYRREEDLLGQFIEDCCDLGSDKRCSFMDLYAEYEVWCMLQNLRPVSNIVLSKKLSERGFPTLRIGRNKDRWKRNIAIKQRIIGGKS